MATTGVDEVPDATVGSIRSFNRFYTRLIGVLDERLASSRFSLTDARVLFELAQADPEPRQVGDVRRALGLDAGYLSRIVNRFDADGLVERLRSPGDGRRVALRLTAAGREVFGQLDRQAADQVRALVGGLDAERRRRLVGAMGTIQGTFAPTPTAAGVGAGPAAAVAGSGAHGDRGRGFVLRAPEPGDLGWVVQRHGALYAVEYGWDAEFEGLCARIVAGYLDGHDPARERAWIAEVDGERAGSVVCARDDDQTARLRLLLVEPWARGLGIGARLVDECLRFARRAGYGRITLFTCDVLVDARRIYQRAGFTLDAAHPERSFGHDLVHQNWSRDL
ncbi:MAG TPA: helix-turn-helix domain-containing GNAT family N-acetyltransferase [Acidimicrobiales bacterium]|nr:helix-turn-helix domain-containing GNAT family N-acetyltransferase [Acidimicrobiales bacterium]